MNKKELLERLDKIECRWYNIDSAYKELRKIALEIGANDLLKGYVNYDTLNTLTKKVYNEKGLSGVKEFLYDVESFDYDVFYIDHYGNANQVGAWTLSMLWYNLEKRIKEL